MRQWWTARGSEDTSPAATGAYVVVATDVSTELPGRLRLGWSGLVEACQVLVILGSILRN